MDEKKPANPFDTFYLDEKPEYAPHVNDLKFLTPPEWEPKPPASLTELKGKNSTQLEQLVEYGVIKAKAILSKKMTEAEKALLTTPPFSPEGIELKKHAHQLKLAQKQVEQNTFLKIGPVEKMPTMAWLHKMAAQAQSIIPGADKLPTFVKDNLDGTLDFSLKPFPEAKSGEYETFCIHPPVEEIPKFQIGKSYVGVPSESQPPLPHTNSTRMHRVEAALMVTTQMLGFGAMQDFEKYHALVKNFAEALVKLEQEETDRKEQFPSGRFVDISD